MDILLGGVEVTRRGQGEGIPHPPKVKTLVLLKTMSHIPYRLFGTH
jgi:hypothetical protein